MALAKALVLCCSKAGLAVARALGARGVPVVGVWYGRTRIVTSSRHVRGSREAPDPAVDEAGFVDFLLTHADEWHGSVLFPTDDASLLAVSRHKARLGGVYEVVAADWAIVRRLLEKLSTYALAEQLGVPAPAVRKVTTLEAAEAFAGQVGFPCLLKPSVGHEFFRRYHAKMIKAASMEELRQAMATLAGYPGEMMLSE